MCYYASSTVYVLSSFISSHISIYFFTILQLSPPVPLWTKTAQWRNQIKVGQEVEVRESTSLVQRPKWHRGTVLAVGDENDMPRDLEGGAELELIDVNDVGAKIPLNLLKRRRQVRMYCVCYVDQFV